LLTFLLNGFFNNLVRQIKVGSASLGIAFFPQHGSDVNQIIKAADAALYQAKRAGRNCVKVWC